MDRSDVALEFQPSLIVNATGAWVDRTLRSLNVESKRLMGGTKGSHFVTSHPRLQQLLAGRAVYTEAGDGRPIFVLPFVNGTLIGTTDEPFEDDPATAVATPRELEYLVAAVNDVFPDLGLTTEDVGIHYAGVRPLPYSDATVTAAVTRRHWMEPNPNCAIPLYSIIGGKLTTCRSLAEEAADEILKHVGLPRTADSKDRPITEPEPSLAENVSDVPLDVAKHVIDTEWVTTLDDLVERRLMLLYHPALRRAYLEQLADLIGRSRQAKSGRKVYGGGNHDQAPGGAFRKESIGMTKPAAKKFVLALDQGTTSSRAILFGHDGRPAATAQREFPQILPAPGIVEHDPESIWDSQLAVARAALKKASATAGDIAAIGVTNQRETTILWERDSGKPVANAIVWQSRVSAPICDRLKADGFESLVQEKSGLVIDAYFSGTKIKHLLDTIPGLRERAERGEVLFGTVDSFLIWRLTGGKRHVTDVTNASRTMLFNLNTLQWDDELLKMLDVPRKMLPEVKSSQRNLRRNRSRIVRRGDSDCRLRGRSASRHIRPGLFRSRQRQEHLRHRLLHAAKRRQQAGAFQKQTIGHGRLADRRENDLLPGRIGIHRRRGCAMVAR